MLITDNTEENGLYRVFKKLMRLKKINTFVVMLTFISENIMQ